MEKFAVAFGGEKSPIGDSQYGSPPWRSFYSCASSRAALHVGSPRLRMGQPSNAPPLFLSPPGLATRRGPQSKTRLGRCPKTPVAGCAGYGFVFPSMIRKTNPYCAQNRSQGSHGRICPFPPPPFPMAGKGPGWAEKIKAAVRRSGYVRACGGGGSRWLGIRSRAPPVADEARRRIRSGRKNRANE